MHYQIISNIKNWPMKFYEKKFLKCPFKDRSTLRSAMKSLLTATLLKGGYLLGYR